VSTPANTPSTASANTPSTASELLKQLRDSAGVIGLGVGALGALLYVVLSYLVARVYAPLGLTPTEVGLDQATLLLRSATAFAGVVGLYGSLVLLAYVVGELGFRGQFSAAALLIIASCVGGAALFRDWHIGLGVLLVVGGFGLTMFSAAQANHRTVGWIAVAAITLYGCSGVLRDAANSDRGRILGGTRPENVVYGLRPPWSAEVVRVAWAEAPSPRKPQLPPCLLYLGEASGTSVLFDARSGHRRALRLPTSKLLIEVLPTTHSMLAPPRGKGSCG